MKKLLLLTHPASSAQPSVRYLEHWVQTFELDTTEQVPVLAPSDGRRAQVRMHAARPSVGATSPRVLALIRSSCLPGVDGGGGAGHRE
eukprot:6208843-Pleurochrysis_carterae.AAC.2